MNPSKASAPPIHNVDQRGMNFWRQTNAPLASLFVLIEGQQSLFFSVSQEFQHRWLTQEPRLQLFKCFVNAQGRFATTGGEYQQKFPARCVPPEGCQQRGACDRTLGCQFQLKPFPQCDFFGQNLLSMQDMTFFRLNFRPSLT